MLALACPQPGGAQWTRGPPWGFLDALSDLFDFSSQDGYLVRQAKGQELEISLFTQRYFFVSYPAMALLRLEDSITGGPLSLLPRLTFEDTRLHLILLRGHYSRALATLPSSRASPKLSSLTNHE